MVVVADCSDQVVAATRAVVKQERSMKMEPSRERTTLAAVAAAAAAAAAAALVALVVEAMAAAMVGWTCVLCCRVLRGSCRPQPTLPLQWLASRLRACATCSPTTSTASGQLGTGRPAVEVSRRLAVEQVTTLTAVVSKGKHEDEDEDEHEHEDKDEDEGEDKDRDKDEGEDKDGDKDEDEDEDELTRVPAVVRACCTALLPPPTHTCSSAP